MLKRCIMIFPDITDIEIVNEIRNKFDPLVSHVKPHITLVFPFESQISSDDLKSHIKSVLSKLYPFQLSLHRIKPSQSGNYLFLTVDKGKEEIIQMHKHLFDFILNRRAKNLNEQRSIIMHENKEFWAAIDQIVSESEIIIDRPKGTRHPKYPTWVYPVDYGYLKGTTSMDDGGIDVWQGTETKQEIDAIICTVDLYKRDSEIKILIGCTEEEKDMIYRLHNERMMKGIMIRRNADSA